MSGTEVTADFAQGGATDRWTAAARTQFTRRSLAAFDKALADLRFGVSIMSEPAGATIIEETTK